MAEYTMLRKTSSENNSPF